MEVRQGYKYTEEFGFIPEDWEINSINDIANVVTGGTPNTAISSFWNGTIKWMNSGELNLKRIVDVKGRITKLGLDNSSTKKIPAKSVLVGLAGQGKTRGTVAITYISLCTNQSIASILPSKFFVSEFLYQSLDKRYSELRMLSAGDGGRGGLNKQILLNLKILLPPIQEQEKIAQVLRDMDKLIESIESLLEKKRNLKIAAMQKLLTPQPHWEEKKINELCDILDTLRIPLNENQRKKGIYPYCGANGVVDYIDSWCVDDDIILIAEDGGYFDEYKIRPIAYKMHGKCWVNNHAHILKSKKSYSQDFIFYSLDTVVN